VQRATATAGVYVVSKFVGGDSGQAATMLCFRRHFILLTFSYFQLLPPLCGRLEALIGLKANARHNFHFISPHRNFANDLLFRVLAYGKHTVGI
jgi:hypothetical protein